MSFLLFPGRHLVNTTFQEQYLKRILTEPPDALPGFIHSVVSLCACECAKRTPSEQVPGVTQATVAP